jgi:hypothetical protein
MILYSLLLGIVYVDVFFYKFGQSQGSSTYDKTEMTYICFTEGVYEMVT